MVIYGWSSCASVTCQNNGGAVQISGLCDLLLVKITQLWLLWLCESGSAISSVLLTESLSSLPCCHVPAVPLQAFLDCLPLHPVFCCPAPLPPQEAAVFCGSRMMFSIPRWQHRAHDFICQPGQQAATWFPTCPSCRAHTAFMSNSFILVACHCGHPLAGNADYANGRIWIIQEKFVWVMTWLPSATCSVLCLVFEEWLVEVLCAADVERLPLGAGFQGCQVIFLSLLSLKLHWLLWWTWEWRQIFLIISCLTFLVLLPSSLKLGRWHVVYDSRGYCSHVVFQRVLLMGTALSRTLSLPLNSVSCSRSL